MILLKVNRGHESIEKPGMVPAFLWPGFKAIGCPGQARFIAIGSVAHNKLPQLMVSGHKRGMSQF